MQSYKNKEPQPIPRDENEKEFFISRGVVLLDDEWEVFIVDIFFKVLEFRDESFYLNYDLSKEYLKEYELELKEHYEILKALLFALNSEILKG